MKPLWLGHEIDNDQKFKLSICTWVKHDRMAPQTLLIWWLNRFTVKRDRNETKPSMFEK